MTDTSGLGLRANRLAALLLRPEVKGIWYNSKEISLDGFKFAQCRFDNCKLIISSTNFEIENCFIDETTVVLYQGDIVKPIRLFNKSYDWVYENMPYFAPIKNQDGTITIKG